MRKIIVLSVFISWFFNLNQASAEPNSSVSWLMAEPASVFDIGMMKLENHLIQKAQQFNSGYDFMTDLTGWPYYDWDKNRIIIIMASHISSYSKERCKILINKLRFYENHAIKSQGYSQFASFFSHEGYISKDQPRGIVPDLDKIMEIKIIMKGGECRGALTSEEVLYPQ